MTRTDRLYALVEELRAVAPRPRSARWLAERFEVSSRTIERDVSALQQSGVPIWAETGRSGGYCLDPRHTLAPLNLTVDEALAVMISLSALVTSPFRDAAASALRKVVAVTGDRSLAESADLATRIHLLGEHRAHEAPREVADALRTGRLLRIAYTDSAGPARCGRSSHWASSARAATGTSWRGADCATGCGRSAAIGSPRPRLLDERPPRRPLRVEDLGVVEGQLRRVGPGGNAS